jgi:hypothetical protein
MAKTRTRNAVDESSLCQFPFADGRTCRMLRYRAHPTLCVFHAQQEQQLLTEAEQAQNVRAIASELTTLSGGFHTRSDIQHVTGKLFDLVAANRVPPRQAKNLTYLLALLSNGNRHVYLERQDAGDHEAFNAFLRKVYPNGREARLAAARAEKQAREAATSATQPQTPAA